MTNNNPIRILHFSDFHLIGSKVEDAKHVVSNMLDAIKDTGQQIDLVIFSGDMIEQGGEGFSNIKEAFESFKKIVIDELCSKLAIGPERFIFTPGNHDVNTKKANDMAELGLNSYITNESNAFDFIKSTNFDSYISKMDDVKKFENDYYTELLHEKYNYGKLASNFIYDIKGLKIGITSFNTVWKFCVEKSAMNLSCIYVLGEDQISSSHQIIEDCSLKLAIMHVGYEDYPEWEKDDVKNMIGNNNYNVLFSGHKHKHDAYFESTNSGSSFLRLKTSGTLTSNNYITDSKYQNAFQILTYYPNEYVEVVCFKQANGQFFKQDMNFGNGNGMYKKMIPNEQQSINKIIEEEERKKTEFLNKIQPFETIEKFLSTITDPLFKNEFITCQKIEDEVISILKNNNNKRHIHFIALSGMGKTRIITETFKGVDNVFFSPTSNCCDGLRNLLKLRENCTIIVDECDIKHRGELKKIIKNHGHNNRLITINNVLSIDEEKVDDDILLKVGYKDTSEIIDKIIEKDSYIKENTRIKDLIKDYAGGIPYMVILLIDAYKKNRTLKIENSDTLLSALLNSSNMIDKKQENVMKSIALFEPLGYIKPVDDEYQYIKSNIKIHHIAENQQIIDVIYEDTINNFKDKCQLIESKGNCIKIRPKPLAEWLTDSWLKEYGNNSNNFITELLLQNNNTAQRLINAFSRRIYLMQYQYPNVKEIYENLNNPQTGFFHNERIVFSEVGSRLFLSMGMVSQIMSAKNLFSLLKKREDDLEWIKINVSNNIRRNIVYAIEQMSRDNEAFPYAAKSLLILAAAENETYSNNATGQFAKMFLLPATLTPLSSRIEILKENVNKAEYIPIIIRAIDSAFESRDFVFFDEIQNPLTEKKYYSPSAHEIKDYWENCAELLIDISQKTPNYDQSIKNMIQKHVYDMYNFGGENILGKLVNYFGAKCDYEWPELRKSLNFYINHWNDGNMIKQKHALVLYERFSPKSFFLRVKDVISNKYIQNKPDFAKFDSEMYELMQPYAKEFVNDKIYLTPELESMINDWDFQSHWLLHEIVNIICVNTSAIKEILDAIVIYLKKEEFNIESPFITQFCLELTKRKDASIIQIEKVFQSKLYELGYYRLSASISGIIEDEEFSYLDKIIKGVKKGKYDNYCVNNYLRRQNLLSGIAKTIYITNKLIEEKFDEDEVIFPYFTNCMRFQINGISELDEIEEILLLYTFSNGTFNTASQVVEIMSDILQKYDRPLFALKVHNKIVDVLSKSLSINNPFENIYQTLLPKYQDKILDQVLEDIANDSKFNYYFKMKNYLGSGFEYGKGPLFCCDYDRLFNACLRFPNTLPDKLSVMCPVIEPNKKPNETFFWRLCDNFGNDKDMLEGFYCNVCTLGFAGYSLSKQLLNCIDIIKPYIKHPNKTVQEWAQKTIESLQQDATERKRQEEYREITSE